MSILITLYSTSWGGAEESIVNLSEEIAKYGHKVIILWIANYLTPKPTVSTRNVSLIYLNLNAKVYKIISGWLVALLCLRYQIKIVNLNWRFVKEESRFLELLRVKSVSTIRAILFDRTNCTEFNNCDAIIGVSRAVVKQVKKLGYAKPCYTVYNGIQIENLQPFNSKLFSHKRILSMSRLVAWKRVDWSIKAIAILHDQGQQVSLDIFGDGPEKENLQKLIKEFRASNYIKLYGHINNHDDVLKGQGIFLIPSFKEPFGKTIVENVLWGRVIVGSRSGGIPELLPNYDLLFKYDNFQDYVDKIALACKNYSKYAKEISNRQDEFRKRYNMARVAKDYIDVYMKVLT